MLRKERRKGVQPTMPVEGLRAAAEVHQEMTTLRHGLGAKAALLVNHGAMAEPTCWAMSVNVQPRQWHGVDATSSRLRLGSWAWSMSSWVCRCYDQRWRAVTHLRQQRHCSQVLQKRWLQSKDLPKWGGLPEWVARLPMH